MRKAFVSRSIPLATGMIIALTSCTDDATGPSNVQCSADNGGITLPAGFCAVVVSDVVTSGVAARLRHIAVTPSGDVFVAINSPGNNNPPFGIIGLRDLNGDGRADQESRFSADLGGSGIAWGQGNLYFGANDRVVRFVLPDGQLSPTGAGAVVVSGLPNTDDHISKTLVLADAQTLFVNIGSGSNACQVADREAQSPGMSPCPELPVRAGVWLFNPAGTNQAQGAGRRYATGLRNMVALAVNPVNDELYGVQHGRDMLFENWPQFFTVEEDAVLPAEEFIRIADGSDNGWPYCYYDAVTENKKVLAPEYGDNGQIVNGYENNCEKITRPHATFGGHWAPNGMTFYTGTQFPDRYRNGVFIAFLGVFDCATIPKDRT